MSIENLGIFKTKTVKKIISIVVLHSLLLTNIAYCVEPDSRSLFKGKRPDYRKIQEQREEALEQRRDILRKKKFTRPVTNQDQNISEKKSRLYLTKELSSIYIPESLGRIVEIYESETGRITPLIVHIQDLHTNPEGQFNEAAILEILIKDYGLDLICSEGAEGEVDTSSVSSFPDPEAREKTARIFVDSGELTAEEYISITKYPDIPIWGVEDKDIYFENIVEFNKIMKSSSRSQVFINQVEEALEKLKPKIYSQALLELDTRYNEFENGNIDINEYLDFLVKLSPSFDKEGFKNIALTREISELENSIDKNAIGKELEKLVSDLQGVLSERDDRKYKILLEKMSLFKDKKIAPVAFYSYLEELCKKYLAEKIADYPNVIKFAQYLKDLNRLNPAILFNEIDEFTYQITYRLSSNENQKLLARSIRHIKILKDFLGLKLSSGQLKYYFDNRQDFNVGFFEKFLNKNLKDYNIDSFIDFNPDFIDALLPELEYFYDIAHKRDIAIYNNTIKEIKKRNARIVALVMGGFHTSGITRLLRENGYSYIVIAPYSSTSIDEDNYKALLSGKRRPISELIEQLNQK